MANAGSLTVGIAGSGRMASALLAALSEKGITVNWLLARDAGKSKNLADRYSVPIFRMDDVPEIPPAELVILAVSDQAIGSMAAKLQPWLKGNSESVLIHTSGGTSVSVLSESAAGHRFLGSLHPIQTFTGDENAGFFEGIYCSVVASGNSSDRQRVLELLQNLAEKLGMNPLTVDDETKKKLHTAAVFCSNYMATLVYAARQVFKDDDVISPEKLPSVMAPLMRTSLENIIRTDPESALTGPVKRGDGETIQRHLDLLQNNEQIKQLYRELGKVTAELAGNKDLIRKL